MAPASARPSKVHRGAWWSLASTMMLMLIAGTIYAWGNFNGIFKSKHGYDLSQSQMELLGTMANLGNYVAIDAGIISMKLGTHITLAYGCILTFVGYTGLWCSVRFANGQLPYWVLVLLCMTYGHGCGSIDNASMTQALSDFPNHKGNVVGCMKAYYGMSSAIITVVFDALFQPDQSSFLIFLGMYSLVMGVMFVPVVRHTKGLVDDTYEQVRYKFKLMTAGICAFVIYFLIVNLEKSDINSMAHNGKPLWLGILASVMLGASSLFLFASDGRLPACAHQDDKDKLNLSLLEESCGGGIVPDHPVDVSAAQMLTRLDFWILMPILIIGQGSGLLWLNNSGQILDAFSGVHMDPTPFVAVISCLNGFGRLTSGTLSEVLAGRCSRVIYLIVSCTLMAGSYLAMFAFGGAVLWPMGAVVGFAYGIFWGVQPVIVSEIFGPKDYSIKYACSAVAAFFGSLILSTLLAGQNYDMQARGANLDPDGICIVSACYERTFIVTSCCGVPALFLGGLLWMRTRWIYKALPSHQTIVPLE